MTKGSSSRLRDASQPPRTNILAELCLPGTYSPCTAIATATWDTNDVTEKQVWQSLGLDSPGKFKITGHFSVLLILVLNSQSSSNSIVRQHVHNGLVGSTNYSVKQLYTTHVMKKSNGQCVICYTYQVSLLTVNEHRFRNLLVFFKFWDSFVKNTRIGIISVHNIQRKYFPAGQKPER